MVADDQALRNVVRRATSHTKLKRNRKYFGGGPSLAAVPTHQTGQIQKRNFLSILKMGEGEHGFNFHTCAVWNNTLGQEDDFDCTACAVKIIFKAMCVILQNNCHAIKPSLKQDNKVKYIFQRVISFHTLISDQNERFSRWYFQMDFLN